MLDREYQRLFVAEEHLWWFRALHLFLSKLIPSDTRTKNLKALDIGCGSGKWIGRLSENGFNAVGLDFSQTALSYSRQRPNAGLVRGDANRLPFIRSFELVVSLDVLELGNIDPAAFAENALRVLKPGGVGVFVMAAHQWLLSEHDRAVNSVRRYNLSQMRNLFQRPDIQILRASYLFFFLFPLIALRKLTNPQRRPDDHRQPESDINLIPAIINEPLYWLCWLEAQLLSRFNLPIGSSVCVMVRKNG
jgi:SAM-dependent methyltransferase